MSIPTIYLRAFLQAVPTCGQASRLGTVLEIFSQSQCERLAVVSEGQRLLGLVRLRRLMPLLAKSLLPDRSLLPPAATPPVTGTVFPELDLEQRLLAAGPALIEPVAILSADLSLSQFWPYLQEDSLAGASERDWALIDAAGQFLGLLDRQRLLKFLAGHWVPEWDATARAMAAPESSQPSILNSQSHSSGAAGPKSLNSLNSLAELLERLPLPLRLLDCTGQVLQSNLAWHRHFPEVPASRDGRGQEPENPGLMGAAGEVGATPSGPEASPGEGADPCAWAAVPSWCQPAWCKPVPPSGGKEGPSSGGPRTAEPAACLSVCRLPGGGEQIWQFVKLPLGIAMPGPRQPQQPDAEKRPPSRRQKEKQEPPSAGSGQARRAGGAYRVPDSAPAASTGGEAATAGGEEETLWLLLAQDVTEQEQVTKELAAKNADLVQLNRLKDEFLACISHELKTPLTAVLGLSSLLKDQAIGQLNERQARYAQLIYQSGRQLMTVVNDILDLTRMESGQLELVIEPVSVPAVCERAIKQAQQLQSAAPGSSAAATPPPARSNAGDCTEEEVSQVQFALEIEAGIETLIADEMRLRQILVNLLSNAFKFTEPGGATGLKVSRWSGWIAFTVWDTGIGIPEGKQHLIFQKFQQLENPLTRRFEGAGLGLVVTRGLARLHGGDVSFISSEGKGSQFTLLLPPHPPRGSAGATTPTAATGEPRIGAARRHRLVLIVEAVPQFIEALTELLTGSGYRVVVARTGTEALDKARRFAPAAIFLNPVLPLLSGWDVLTLLKSDAATRQIPAIVTATLAHKEQAYQNRADGFLTLPVSRGALQHLFGSLIEQTPQPATALTVLRLNALPEAAAAAPEHRTADSFMPAENLNSLLQQAGYRVLEADDLEQAELLAGLWQPDVLLLDTAGQLPDPLAYLKQLSGHSSLAKLPLVALDREIAVAASLVPGLSVFPFPPAAGGAQSDILGSPSGRVLDSPAGIPAPAALLQLLVAAAGMSCQPVILVVDTSTLPDLPAPADPTSDSAPFAPPQPKATPAPRESLPTGNPHPKGMAAFVGRGTGVGPLGGLLAQTPTLDPPLPLTPPCSPITPTLEETLLGKGCWRLSEQSLNGSEARSGALAGQAGPAPANGGLPALIQYMQTAGLRVLIGRSWAEVWQQLQSQSADLLLICLAEPTNEARGAQALVSLGQLPAPPPVLVLDRRSKSPPPSGRARRAPPPQERCFYSASCENNDDRLDTVLQEIATQILPSDLPVASLLNHINQALARRIKTF
ncbi:ATP-binding response regulator [Kamptonema formosum]|uniref:ATP-binding response regulator n=1 Tax=Kamptonema formosum TaxID=331992 RepID=UPI00034A1EE2|nr:ATP-binding protein [Oscillatoria sp. PCC 10802]